MIRNRKLFIAIAVFIFIHVNKLFGQEIPNVSIMNRTPLAKIRSEYAAGSREAEALIQPLLLDAKSTLKQKPLSVTTKSTGGSNTRRIIRELMAELTQKQQDILPKIIMR